jgi:hypothetical protein
LGADFTIQGNPPPASPAVGMALDIFIVAQVCAIREAWRVAAA